MNQQLRLHHWKAAFLIFLATLAPRLAFGYSYTLENFGGAPIFFAHAHTVSNVCHDVTIDLPPGGLLPGQSVSFDTASICLVDSIAVSYHGPWDFHTPWFAWTAPFDWKNPRAGTTPLLYPPQWNNGVGVASGTFVVSPGAICYSSGFLDFFKNFKKNTIDKLTREVLQAAGPVLPALAGGCSSTPAQCWTQATEAIWNLFVTAATPTEVSRFLSLQSTAWAWYSNMGFTKIMIPQQRMVLDHISQALPQSLLWQDLDPNLLRTYGEQLHSNIGCGW